MFVSGIFNYKWFMLDFKKLNERVRDVTNYLRFHKKDNIFNHKDRQTFKTYIPVYILFLAL